MKRGKSARPGSRPSSKLRSRGATAGSRRPRSRAKVPIGHREVEVSARGTTTTDFAVHPFLHQQDDIYLFFFFTTGVLVCMLLAVTAGPSEFHVGFESRHNTWME